MGILGMGGGGPNGDAFVMKFLTMGAIMMVMTPILFALFIPTQGGSDPYQEAMDDANETFRRITGSYSTPQQCVWTLKGIYMPYAGEGYNYTNDGWLYGEEVKSYIPKQYESNQIPGYPSELMVAKADNGLWYYINVPTKPNGEPLLKDIKLAKWDDDNKKVTDYEGATVYSTVYFDKGNASDIFFTPSGKTTTDDGHFYYEYTGYRYSYGPLSDFNFTQDGKATQVKADSTSLSLIWYQYATTTGGIQGQLSISGNDQGLSYLTAQDIIRVFQSANMTATFDMTFNGGVKMHLVIAIDPYMYSLLGGDVEALYNGGYFSTLVYSDAIAESMTAPTFEFSIENIFGTVIDILTFNLAERYEVQDWVGLLVSLIITMPMYIALIAIAVSRPELWLVVGGLALFQTIGSLWPFRRPIN